MRRPRPFTALLASDRAHYHVANPAVAALSSCCGPGRHCGDQVANHSCNLLIEITQRCNLTCPTCYAESSPANDHFITLARFDELLDSLLAPGPDGTSPECDVMQLSGGEPTLHPDLFAMIDHAVARGVRRVYVNTNGIKLAKRALCERLAAYGDRVGVYLQLDGLSEPATLKLRGESGLLARKLIALGHLEALGVPTVLVMTLAPGINDDELGPIITRAAASPVVNKIMVQPAMYSGRYDNPRLVRRLTVGDVARLAAEQTGVFTSADFLPIPCSDPNCFAMALALKTPSGLVPVSRFFPRYSTWADSGVAELVARVSDSFDRAADLRSVIDWLASGEALAAMPESAIDGLLDMLQAVGGLGETGWGAMLAIGVKPFMDAWTYDQDRIDKCCVHVGARDGTPVSFCEYNALRRPTGRL